MDINIQTLLKTIPSKKRSFPGGNNDNLYIYIYSANITCSQRFTSTNTGKMYIYMYKKKTIISDQPRTRMSSKQMHGCPTALRPSEWMYSQAHGCPTARGAYVQHPGTQMSNTQVHGCTTPMCTDVQWPRARMSSKQMHGCPTALRPSEQMYNT